MVYQILNGDSLANTFPEAKLGGTVIVVREAFMDGDVSGDGLHQFWQSRSKYLGVAASDYENSVVKEFEK